MRMIRFVVLPALLAGALFCDVGGAAAQGSPEARQACAPDAMRLCAEFIPDVPKITACMKRKHRELSRDCQVAMHSGRHAEHHHARARRAHCDKFTHLCS